MRTAGAIFAAAIAGGLLAAAPAARPAGKVVTMRMHDTLEIAGSHILCGYAISNGQTFVDCGIPGSNGQPKRGSYVATMTTKGKVAIVAASTNKIVFDEIAGPMLRAGDVVAHPGDTIKLLGTTRMACSASKVGGAATVFCDQYDAKGNIRHGSLAFGMSDSVVTALGWTAKGKVFVIKSWPENG
jgi:hypothetical protein